MKKLFYPRRLNFLLSKRVGSALDALAEHFAAAEGLPVESAKRNSAIERAILETAAKHLSSDTDRKAA